MEAIGQLFPTKVIVILFLVVIHQHQILCHSLPLTQEETGRKTSPSSSSSSSSSGANLEKVDAGLLQQPHHRDDDPYKSFQSPSSSLSSLSSSSPSAAAAALIMSPLSSMISKMSGMRQMRRRDVAGQDDFDDENSSGGNNNNAGADPVFYPMLISKKSATALNKIIYALKTSLEPAASVEQGSAGFDTIHGFPRTGLAAGAAARPGGTVVNFKNFQPSSPHQLLNAQMYYDPYNPHLQRRGQQKDRKNYLRCYFNAVSCF